MNQIPTFQTKEPLEKKITNKNCIKFLRIKIFIYEIFFIIRNKRCLTILMF